MTGGAGTGHTGGVATALGEALSQAERGEDLLGEVVGPPPGRRVGRPVGAHNRRTEAYAALLIARHGDPLARAVEIAAIDLLGEGDALGDLAAKLRVKREVALDFLAKTRNAVFPYLHQEQPRAVTISKGAPGNPLDADQFFGKLIDGDFSVTEPGPGTVETGADGAEQNQSLSDDAAA